MIDRMFIQEEKLALNQDKVLAKERPGTENTPLTWVVSLMRYANVLCRLSFFFFSSFVFCFFVKLKMSLHKLIKNLVNNCCCRGVCGKGAGVGERHVITAETSFCGATAHQWDHRCCCRCPCSRTSCTACTSCTSCTPCSASTPCTPCSLSGPPSTYQPQPAPWPCPSPSLSTLRHASFYAVPPHKTSNKARRKWRIQVMVK